MSYALAANWRAANNTNGYMGGKVGFCIHHAAGFNVDMTGTFLTNNTSAHYGIEPGRVMQFLADKNNAWAAGQMWANNRLIHIECVNASGAPDWDVAEKTIDTLVEFLADKCREHNFDKLSVGDNLFGHRDFFNTSCPGVLYGRLDEIAERVNALLRGEDDNENDSEETMQCIIQPNGETKLCYFDGAAIHYLEHPDQVAALNITYNACHGRDIPCFALGSADAPWASRLLQAVKSNDANFAAF